VSQSGHVLPLEDSINALNRYAARTATPSAPSFPPQWCDDMPKRSIIDAYAWDTGHKKQFKLRYRV